MGVLKMNYAIEDYSWVYGHSSRNCDYLLELELKDITLKERYTDNVYSGNTIEYVLSSGKYYEWCDGKKVLPAEYLK